MSHCVSSAVAQSERTPSYWGMIQYGSLSTTWGSRHQEMLRGCEVVFRMTVPCGGISDDRSWTFTHKTGKPQFRR